MTPAYDAAMSTYNTRIKDRLAAIAREAMTERTLQPDFSTQAMSELKMLAAQAAMPAPHDADIRDLRSLPWASIDNDDSRDLDQLSVSGRSPDGAATILVAVADVDALVKRGSALDAHAANNTTSVYTAGGIFPMLPEQLSTDLTSLGENADRLALVIEMSMGGEGAEGEIKDATVYRALVRNHAKLAYNALAEWLDGGAMPPHLQALLPTEPQLEAQLRTQDRIAQAMRKRRHEQGSLRLRTPQAQAVFANDELIDLQSEAPNRAKELIEEFMVAANGVIARFLAAKGYPSLRRVLQSPERWERIAQLAKDLGEQLPRNPDSHALELFLMKRREVSPSTFPDLSLSIVKLLGRGEYAAEAPGQKAEGHFALAVHDYTHSTAPNRRYPDLVTQRQVKAALAGSPAAYSLEELRDIAAHCTVQEGNVAKVERHVAKSAAALLLTSRIGQHFEGIITGASDKGTWVRIEHPAAEGMVAKGAKGLDVGDRVRVVLLRADVERGFIDFAREGAR